MPRVLLLIGSIIYGLSYIHSEIIWTTPPPFTEYCNGQCFEVYDTVIGWVRDTTPYKRHFIIFFKGGDTDIFNTNVRKDTIQVPMRNFRFTKCFNDTGRYWNFDLFTSLDQDGIERCCSGGGSNGFIIIKGCPPVSSFLTNTDTICTDECLYLTDSSMHQPTNWLWQFHGNTTATYTGKSPPAICYPTAGEFPIQLIVSNAYGADTSIKQIKVAKCSDCIYAPTAFSPNNDGINDLFKVYTNCILEAYHIQIYSRWGNLIFESDNIQEPWNGTYKSVNCETGSYYYVITFKNYKSGRAEYKKGNLLLIL